MRKVLGYQGGDIQKSGVRNGGNAINIAVMIIDELQMLNEGANDVDSAGGFFCGARGCRLRPRARPQTRQLNSVGFRFGFAQVRSAVDLVFEAGALELLPAPAPAGSVRPSAARTFFEGPRGPYP